MQRGRVMVCLVKPLVGIAVCPECRFLLCGRGWDLLSCYELPLLGVEDICAAHQRAAG